MDARSVHTHIEGSPTKAMGKPSNHYMNSLLGSSAKPVGVCVDKPISTTYLGKFEASVSTLPGHDLKNVEDADLSV